MSDQSILTLGLLLLLLVAFLIIAALALTLQGFRVLATTLEHLAKLGIGASQLGARAPSGAAQHRVRPRGKRPSQVNRAVRRRRSTTTTPKNQRSLKAPTKRPPKV